VARELEGRLEGAPEEAHRARAGAVATQALDSRLDHVGPVRKSEVVVRREHEHLAESLHLDYGALRRAQDVRPLVRPRLAEHLELGAQRARELVACDAHRCVHLAGPEVVSTGSRTGLSTAGRSEGLPPG